MPFQFKLWRLFAALCLFAFISGLAGKASAASPDPRMFGGWVVADSENVENLGLRAFFSPDGNFLMVDPKTQLGMAGSWTVGRAGLLVSILGNSKWGKLWDADVSFKDDDNMILDVKDSQFSSPHRVTLQRIKLAP
jgi:hypothetical protein